MTSARVLAVLGIAVLTSAHVGSPDVFFSGKAGAYDISVIVQPPEVVPGVARVTVRAPLAVTRVSIRPVYWRAGSKGAPSADAMHEGSVDATHRTFTGSLWLMSRGAYTVDVIVDDAKGAAGNVLVPVASVATGRLALTKPFAALLVVLGVFLVTGLINIVRKGAGEGLLAAGKELDAAARRTSAIAATVAFAVLSLAVLGAANWWDAVDADYQNTIYKPSPLALGVKDGVLHIAASDTQYLPSGRAARYVPDHGKLMHLFLVGQGAFAHLHPVADSAVIPAFAVAVPAALPAGSYRVYADVVQETGFERTMVGAVDLPATRGATAKPDADDGAFLGEPTRANSTRLADGSIMTLDLDRARLKAGEPFALRVVVEDSIGRRLPVQQYLGMPAHAVVTRADGQVYVHLHPMGTITMAAQEVFAARDRGDTTATGELLPAMSHAGMPGMRGAASPPTDLVPATQWPVEFPYAFPKAGDYQLYVQVKRGGKVLTGAFAVQVAEPAPATK